MTLRDELLQLLVDEYYASRPNLDVAHAPLCVFFFACSGAGKSTIRRQFVRELQATYVCNDEVRELMLRHPEAAEQGVELKAVVAATVERIFAEAPNKFVIFDNNIIHYYMHDDSYYKVALKKQRPVFLVGLEAPEEVLAERIRVRGMAVEEIPGGLPAQIRDYNRAIKDLQPDVRIQSGDDSAAQLLAHQLRRLAA